MRASRLVSLLLLLQARGRMTAQALAAELEVSVRTIYRDVESLHAAGVPLYGDAGRAGGYQLLHGYRTRLTGLTGAEAESLAFAGLPGPAAELGLGSVAAAASLKLMAALPAELRDRAGHIASRFHLDTPAWYHDPDDTPHLAAVADAVWQERALRVQYHRWRPPQEVTRTLEPYGLVLKAGRWYLVARGSGRRLATYRVAAIRTLEPLPDRFTRPADFDLAGYWRSYLDDFQARRLRGEAVVLLSARGLRLLPDSQPDAVVKAVAATGVPVGDGWTRAVIPIESVEHALGDLLRLGTEIEVLGPVELRERVTETIATLAMRYRPQAPQDPLRHPR
ncbi:MAG: helix-turn-helix transcriptional regulator [Labedaea sp.]